MKHKVMCSWCGRLPPTEPNAGADVLIQNEPEQTVAICGHCVSDAVVAIYNSGGSLPMVTERLRDEFLVSRAFEENMKDEIRAELRDRYQRDLLYARDPFPVSEDNPSRLVSITMNKHMRSRVVALARESKLSISAWVRKAVFIAFEMTKHTA